MLVLACDGFALLAGGSVSAGTIFAITPSPRVDRLAYANS